VDNKRPLNSTRAQQQYYQHAIVIAPSELLCVTG
jgi:hypothetical protein